MKLKTWRTEVKNLSLAQAATLIGVTTVALGRYERGRVPDPIKLQKIIQVTEGAVTANDFFDLPESLPQQGQAAE